MVSAATRSQTQRDVAIDVAVQKKLGQEQNVSLDPLLVLAEEIAEHFRAKRLDSFPGALCVKTEFKPIYAPEHIEQLPTFTSVLTLTFRVIE
jgi:DNA-binding XRE family transcriptional regulator